MRAYLNIISCDYCIYRYPKNSSIPVEIIGSEVQRYHRFIRNIETGKIRGFNDELFWDRKEEKPVSINFDRVPGMYSFTENSSLIIDGMQYPSQKLSMVKRLLEFDLIDCSKCISPETLDFYQKRRF